MIDISFQLNQCALEYSVQSENGVMWRQARISNATEELDVLFIPIQIIRKFQTSELPGFLAKVWAGLRMRFAL